MTGIGVIGHGYWGPNLVRNFMDTPGAFVAAVSDVRPDRLALLATRYPSIRTTTDHRELLADPRIDAIAVATPVATHYPLTLEALRAGKHVLVEKPLAASSEQALRLIEEAARRRLVLLVDHTFVYTGAVRKIREIVASGGLGDIYYYDSMRVNLGLFQDDVNVMWDLAVHDLSIVDFVLASRPVAVSATGMSHVPGRPENLAYLTLLFEQRQIAHIHVNWLAPVKIRRTLIGGSDRMIVYDDLEPSEKIRIYDRGLTLSPSPQAAYELLVGYRTGDMWAPKVDRTEALRLEAAHFVDCIQNGATPVTDGQAGLRVVRILEAAERSLSAKGQAVELRFSEEPA